MGNLLVYLDSNALITMDQTSSRISSPQLMGSLLSPEFDVRVTSTVIGEIDPDRNPTGSDWLTEQILSGNVTRRETDAEYPPGVRGNGERSIVYDIEHNGVTSQVVIVTDDRRATNMIQRELPNGNVETLTLQGYVESSLFTGGTTYVDYINIAFQNGWNPVGMSELRQQVTNGAVVEATPEGLLITSPTGVVTLVQATDYFRLSEAGEVEVLGSSPGNECFLSGTLIAMWPTHVSIDWDASTTSREAAIRAMSWTKPIEEIEPGDLVVSYDAEGNLQPGRVTRTFKNEVTHVLDFWGMGITPGHATLCGDGEFKDQHVPILDILRSDGAIVMDDGTLVRAATGCTVGSDDDRLIHAIVGDKQPDGRIQIREHAQIRLGTRVLLDDGRDVSISDLITVNGGIVTADGYVRDRAGAKIPFWWSFSEHLPKPEDYILQRSAVDLDAIYIAGEWESIGTQLPAPAERPAGRMQSPGPNIPPAFAYRTDKPRVSSTVKIH